MLSTPSSLTPQGYASWKTHRKDCCANCGCRHPELKILKVSGETVKCPVDWSGRLAQLNNCPVCGLKGCKAPNTRSIPFKNGHYRLAQFWLCETLTYREAGSSDFDWQGNPVPSGYYVPVDNRLTLPVRDDKGFTVARSGAENLMQKFHPKYMSHNQAICWEKDPAKKLYVPKRDRNKRLVYGYHQSILEAVSPTWSVVHELKKIPQWSLYYYLMENQEVWRMRAAGPFDEARYKAEVENMDSNYFGKPWF